MGSTNVSVLDPGAGDDTLGLELASLSFELHDTQFAADAARQRPERINVLDPDAQPALSEDEDEFAGADKIWGFEAKQRVEKNVFRVQEKKVVGAARKVPRARLLPVLLDVAFAGAAPLNCEPSQCAVLGKMFEWRRAHDLQAAARYKYVLDVDGNGWSSRFKRLMNSGSLIFKASAYPEWFSDRLAPWVHYVPIQNLYTDLLDTLLFFRAHDERGARIAAAGCEWSRRFWREEDLVAYNFRLFLEYARVMSADRAAMSFVMWKNERDDELRELALRARWETKSAEGEDED
ncbi:glycosyl transferase family 90-domain-containing protein [Mycena metata]|uniref:Glycosyl transferase family 90-domain-containing protein n=1 Tax=Mycena metata TaxID=1033252 RepID=A0AAD7HJB7_9AGAR|nr:glycosyl transferase family 90-domain-containing protein [Mycena metata]